MRPRRGPSRLGALLSASPTDVLTATVRRAGDAATALERGLRTAAAVATVPDTWQWPRWLDRQLRPNHPAFVPPGEAGVIENVTGRDWRQVGTASSGPLASVDPRGLVVPIGGGWSLDWLVGAEDRWHRPARDAGVRQRLVDGAPVVETACRVPGGDIVQRVYGVTLGGDLGDALVVEVENLTAVPVALALTVRPVDLQGAGSITTVGLAERHVLVDGRPVLVFDRAPARYAAGDAHRDALATVVAGEAEETPFDTVRDPHGLAHAAFVVPVTHRTSVRVIVLSGADRRVRPAFEGPVPPADAVGRGWAAHAERGASIELPDERLTTLWSHAVRNLLLVAGGGVVAPPSGRDDRWSVADEARIVCALQRAGLHDAAGAVLRRRGDEFELDGWFRRDQPSLARNRAIFHAVGDAWALARDRDTVEAVLGPTVKAAHWSERFRARGSRTISAAEAYATHDALLALSTALAGVEQPEAAQDVAAFAARFVLDHDEPEPADLSDHSDPLVITRHGVDTVATVDRATSWVEAGDPAALAVVSWLTEVAADRGRWPTYVHARLGTGCGGTGDDPLAAAAVVELVRAFALRVRGAEIALLPVVPESWFGHSIDVRDVPTPHGRVSYSVRWHGERPALLWELEPHDPPGPDETVTITVPGLDPTFSTGERRGETLLAAPPVADASAPGTSIGDSPADSTGTSTGDPPESTPVEPGSSFS